MRPKSPKLGRIRAPPRRSAGGGAADARAGAPRGHVAGGGTRRHCAAPGGVAMGTPRCGLLPSWRSCGPRDPACAPRRGRRRYSWARPLVPGVGASPVRRAPPPHPPPLRPGAGLARQLPSVAAAHKPPARGLGLVPASRPAAPCRRQPPNPRTCPRPSWKMRILGSGGPDRTGRAQPHSTTGPAYGVEWMGASPGARPRLRNDVTRGCRGV